MKSIKYFLAVLPIVSGLLLTACSNEEVVTDLPQQPSTQNFGTIPYTITVNSGDITRATIDAESETTIQFSENDKVYLLYNYSSYNGECYLYGTLDLESMSTNKTQATFSGNLYNVKYKANNDYTLVDWSSHGVTVDEHNSRDGASLYLINDGFSTRADRGKNPPLDPYTYDYGTEIYTSVEEALQHKLDYWAYGRFADGQYTFRPETAYLEFTITFQDGTKANTDVTVEAYDLTSSDDGTDDPVRAGTVRTYQVGEGDEAIVQAKFVIALPGTRGGRTIDGEFSSSRFVTQCGEDPVIKVNDTEIRFSSKLPSASFSSSRGYSSRVYHFSKTIVGTPTVNYEAVDLGLPSGLKWATTNIGASAPEESGLFFQWSSTDGHSATEGFDFNGVPEKIYTKYMSATELSNDDDAAITYMGVGWRIPSQADVLELINNTTWTKDEVNGVQGFRFTNKTDASKSIFIPQYKGYNRTTANVDNVFVWTRTRADNFTNAYALYYDETLVKFYDFATQQNTLGSKSVGYGLPIRGVYEEEE